MAGGLLQLSYKAINSINKNPEVTFFKRVYRRYTNFAIQQFENYPNKTPKFGDKITIPVNKIADLVSSMVIKVIINVGEYYLKEKEWIDRLGFYLFRKISLHIGGKVIDSYDSEWQNIYYEIFCSHNSEYLNIINGVYDNDNLIILLPLKFWFNRNIAASLPLICLLYQDIDIVLEINDLDNLYFGNSDVKIINLLMISDYIFLEHEERQRIARSSQEIIIDTIRIYDYSATTGINRYTIPERYNIKELYWNVSIKSARIIFNGQDRVKKLPGIYFECGQPYSHHSRIPLCNIGMYSFSLYPELYQPSGFARVYDANNVILELDMDEANFSVYCSVYRIFRISGGYSDIVERD